jgi:hypothetical protein
MFRTLQSSESGAVRCYDPRRCAWRAHLRAPGWGWSETVSVRFPPTYERLRAEVVATSSFREDLALLRIAAPPPGADFRLALVYGRALQANSGSPVFQGRALVGLHEISP